MPCSLFDLLPEEVLQVDMLPHLTDNDLSVLLSVSTYFRENVLLRLQEIELSSQSAVTQFREYFANQQSAFCSKWGIPAGVYQPSDWDEENAASTERALLAELRLLVRTMQAAIHRHDDHELFEWNDVGVSSCVCSIASSSSHHDPDTLHQQIKGVISCDMRRVLEFIGKHGSLLDHLDANDLGRSEFGRTPTVSLETMCMTEVFCFGKRLLFHRQFIGDGVEVYCEEVLGRLFTTRASVPWSATTGMMMAKVLNTHARLISILCFSSGDLFARSFLENTWVSYARRVREGVSNSRCRNNAPISEHLQQTMNIDGARKLKVFKRIVLHSLNCLRENSLGDVDALSWTTGPWAATLCTPESLFLMSILWFPDLHLRHPKLLGWLSRRLLVFWLHGADAGLDESTAKRDALFFFLKQRTTSFVKMCCCNDHFRIGLHRSVVVLSQMLETEHLPGMDPLVFKKVFLYYFAERRECTLLAATMKLLNSAQKAALYSSEHHPEGNSVLHAGCRSGGLLQGVVCILRDELQYPSQLRRPENHQRELSWSSFTSLQNKDGKTAVELLGTRMRKKIQHLLLP